MLCGVAAEMLLAARWQSDCAHRATAPTLRSALPWQVSFGMPDSRPWRPLVQRRQNASPRTAPPRQCAGGLEVVPGRRLFAAGSTGYAAGVFWAGRLPLCWTACGRHVHHRSGPTLDRSGAIGPPSRGLTRNGSVPSPTWLHTPPTDLDVLRHHGASSAEGVVDARSARTIPIFGLAWGAAPRTHRQVARAACGTCEACPATSS